MSDGIIKIPAQPGFNHLTMLANDERPSFDDVDAEPIIAWELGVGTTPPRPISTMGLCLLRGNEAIEYPNGRVVDFNGDYHSSRRDWVDGWIKRYDATKRKDAA